jgi:hypothetical protein
MAYPLEGPKRVGTGSNGCPAGLEMSKYHHSAKKWQWGSEIDENGMEENHIPHISGG